MAIIIDDDFQSYTVGAVPPYGTLLRNTITGGFNTTIDNTVPGPFSDTQNVAMGPSKGLLWPVNNTFTPPIPEYTEFTIISYNYILPVSNNEQGELFFFFSLQPNFFGKQVLAIGVYSDGTIGIETPFGGSGQIPVKISDFSLLTGQSYKFQVNISFSDVGGDVWANVEIAVNDISILSWFGSTTFATTDLPATYINALGFMGNSGGSQLGRLTVYDTIQPIGTVPHPGTPEARVSQAVIELILGAASSDISITCPPATTGKAGTAYSSAFGVTDLTGTPPYTFAKTSGSFPTGLSLDTTSGLLSGTPTTAGAFTFAVTVTDFQGNTSDPVSCTITIAIAITCPPATTANIFEPYSSNIGTSGDTPPDTFSITSGALPTGLSLNTSTGNIHGAPTVLGVFNFTVHVVDADGNTGSQPCTITIIAVRPERFCTTL